MGKSPEGKKEPGSERRFVCTWEGCDKTFKQSTHLMDHVNAVHKKIKPHKCPVVECDYRCTQRTAIKKHVLVHHKELWQTLVSGKL